MRDALRTKLHFLLNVDGDASVVGSRPVANPGDARQRAAAGARGICRIGYVVGTGTDMGTGNPLPPRRLLSRAFQIVGGRIHFLPCRGAIVRPSAAAAPGKES